MTIPGERVCSGGGSVPSGKVPRIVEHGHRNAFVTSTVIIHRKHDYRTQDGDPYVTTRLYEIGLLHGGFLQNTYGGSPSHRRLADAMQLSVVDWCVDYNYYKVTYKLRQEVRESTYSQAQARILAETNVGGKFGGHVPPSP